ncbi:hypothetical protein V6N13_004895 [Hibiscus sabdariffa]
MDLFRYGLTYRFIQSSLLAKLFEKCNIENLITNVGAGGSGGAPVVVAAPVVATDGGGVTALAIFEETKKGIATLSITGGFEVFTHSEACFSIDIEPKKLVLIRRLVILAQIKRLWFYRDRSCDNMAGKDVQLGSLRVGEVQVTSPSEVARRIIET